MNSPSPSATSAPTSPSGERSAHVVATASVPGASGLDHCPLMPVFGAPTLTFVRGRGTELWDADGKRYLDFLCGLAVTSLGHSHPEVADAVAEQARTLLHVSNLFATTVGPQVAMRLDAMLGGGGQIFFANSGAEANECAAKLARKWGGRGRHEVITAFGSFHGRTLATLHMTGQPAKHEAFQPLPEGFRHAVWADIADLERLITPETAAVLIEPVQGEGGIHPAPAGYFADIRKLCDERNLLFMVDEIQTGLARTGSWFAFQQLLPRGVRPDVVTIAKALGNGMPIGACWATREVSSAFKPGDHGSTYSGQPLASSAALAVLQIMERIDAPALASAAGDYLCAELSKVPGVDHVRGMGLLLGVELAAGNAKDVHAHLMSTGLVTNAVTPTALRLAPPITVSRAEIEEAVAMIAASIAACVPASPDEAPGGASPDRASA
jgi:acetylornithine/N-succinyldiaminopimelate aminotransferase